MNAQEIREGINEIPDDVLEEISHSKFNTQNISGGKIGEKEMKALKVLGALTLIGVTGSVFGRNSKIKSERERIAEDNVGDSDKLNSYFTGFKTGLALQHNNFGDDLNKYKPKVDIDKLTDDKKNYIKTTLLMTDSITLT